MKSLKGFHSHLLLNECSDLEISLQILPVGTGKYTLHIFLKAWSADVVESTQWFLNSPERTTTQIPTGI